MRKVKQWAANGTILCGFTFLNFINEIVWSIAHFIRLPFAFSKIYSLKCTSCRSSIQITVIILNNLFSLIEWTNELRECECNEIKWNNLFVEHNYINFKYFNVVSLYTFHYSFPFHQSFYKMKFEMKRRHGVQWEWME